MANPWASMADNKYDQRRVKQAVDLARTYIRPNSTVLDIGCNTSYLKQYLPENVRYIGLDRLQVDLNRLETLPSSFESVQTVFLLEVLEHLLDPIGILHWVSGVLADDGVLVVSLPNEANGLARVRCLLGVVDVQAFEADKHLHFPNLKQSRQFLRNAGYELLAESFYTLPIRHASGWGWLPPCLDSILDTINHLLSWLNPSLFARGAIFLFKHGQRTV